MTRFHEILKRLRRESGMSQAKLASLLHVGRSTVGDWETTSKEPDYEMLIKLADIFDVSTDELLGREELY